MTRKITGIILLIIGGLFSIVLFTGGGLIWPHIIGPSTLAVMGLILLVPKRKAK